MNTGTNQERNPDGTFPKGVSGNPAGKPKGTRHMTTKIVEAITAVSEGSIDSEDREIVKALVRKAKDGDIQAIKIIFNYVDGMPIQGIEHTGAGGEPLSLTVKWE